MSKTLVFCNTTFKDHTGAEVATWEVFNFGGDCPIIHAMWDPRKLQLVCQYNSVKENLVDYPSQTKSGKVTFNERRLEQYFTAVIKDHDAVEHILSTFVSNYDGQPWKMEYTTPSPVQVEEISEEEYQASEQTKSES